MASSGVSSRSRLLTAGGILSMVGGALAVVGGGIMVSSVIAHREMFGLVGHDVWGGTPAIYFGGFGLVELTWLIIVGVPLLVLGALAIMGGVSSVRRKSFGLSLAGAICALPSVIAVGALPEAVFFHSLAMAICGVASIILGILAIVFVALSKGEFEAKA
jgi:hypothetical protein